MSFHSTSFGVFLMVVLVAFWAVSRRRNLRTAVLLAASYLFYGCFNWWFLCLIGFSTVLDWHIGNAIHRSRDPRVRRALLLASLGGNLGLLSFFKYYDWGMSGVGSLLGAFGVDYQHEVLVLAVPVGISFYTFQTLSYTIDIYRGTLKPARNALDFAVFVAFFPQLVAGPIVRAAEFLPQLELKPRFDRARLHDGLFRIGVGLLKKVAIADILGGYLVDPVYGAPDSYTAWVHLLAIYGFAFQIYFDFSGYSDIAIGTARLFGFDLPENFRQPYQSRSVREFWRRWHISLSSWVRDYVYFPLGGSRASEPRVWANLMITMLIIGVWHGASALWVVYGLLQGAAMCLERFFERRRGGAPFATTPLRSAISWFLTFQFTALSLLCVRCSDFAQVDALLSDFGAIGELSPYALWALAGAALTQFLPARLHLVIQRRLCALPTPVCGLILGVVCGFVAFLVVGETPYIYFQF